MQQPGHRLQHPIAHSVAEAIVDRLEAIEIEEQQRHPIAVALGRGQGPVGELEQQGPVGQAGEGIVQGPVPDRLLAAMALAHVLEHAHVVDHLQLRVAHR